MALVLGTGISCTCAAADTETGTDSSLAKLEAVDASEAEAIGLSEQQLSEAFAFVAYDINENYLKPNNLSVESISWEGCNTITVVQLQHIYK